MSWSSPLMGSQGLSKRPSGRMSTERLHYFTEPLGGRQVSFYSDRSASSSDRDEGTWTGCGSSSSEVWPNWTTVVKQDGLLRSAHSGSCLEEMLMSDPERQYLTKRPGTVDQGMTELSKQMQMWSEEALRRRTAMGRRDLEGLSVSLSCPSSSCCNQSSSRSLVIKLSPMSSQSSLTNEKVSGCRESSFTAIRSPTTSFLSRVSENDTSTEEEEGTAREELVEIPSRVTPSRPSGDLNRKQVKRREYSASGMEPISSYDAASFRSASSGDEESSRGNFGAEHRMGPVSRFPQRVQNASRRASRMVRKILVKRN